MTPMLKLAVAAGAGMLVAGTAQAQSGNVGSPQLPGYTAENTTVRNGGDFADRDAEKARNDAVEAQRIRERQPRKTRSVPAKPEEILAGAEVFDPKGAAIGTIESVSVGSAVVATSVGKVEVPLEAFGKNHKGLLIAMSKAEFEKVVAEANKPK